MILTLRDFKECVFQTLHACEACAIDDDLLVYIFNLLDEQWMNSNETDKLLHKTNSYNISDICKSIANGILNVLSKNGNTAEQNKNHSRNMLQKVLKEHFHTNILRLNINSEMNPDNSKNNIICSAPTIDQGYSKVPDNNPSRKLAVVDNFNITDLFKYQALLFEEQSRLNKKLNSNVNLNQKMELCEHLLPKTITNVQDDLELIKLLSADPAVPENEQPSTLAAFVLGEYIMTPDVRPSDRRRVTDFVMKPMGAIWNEFDDEIDRQTSQSLDRNYTIPSNEMEFYADLLKTCSNEGVDLIMDTNVIHGPNIIDYGATLKLARDHCDELMSSSINKKSTPTVNVYSVTKDKNKNRNFKLHNEDALTESLDQMRLPNSKLDMIFEEEIELWRKPLVKIDDKLAPISENDTFLAQLKSQLKEETKLYMEEEITKNKDACRQKLQRIDGQWNARTILPDGLLGLAQTHLPELQFKRRERIEQLEQEIKRLLQPNCFICLSKPEKNNSIRIMSYKVLQSRLEMAWNKLLMPDEQRTSLLADLCLKADEKLEMIIGSKRTWKYVDAWEKAAFLVQLRESLVISEAKVELEANGPNICSKSGTADKRVAGAKRRTVLHKDFSKIDQQINDLANLLKNDYNCTLTFRGEPYLEKKSHDRSDLHYHIHRFHNQNNANRDEDVGGDIGPS